MRPNVWPEENPILPPKADAAGGGKKSHSSAACTSPTRSSTRDFLLWTSNSPCDHARLRSKITPKAKNESQRTSWSGAAGTKWTLEAATSPMGGGPAESAIMAQIAKLVNLADLETVTIKTIRKQLQDHFGQPLDKKVDKALLGKILSEQPAPADEQEAEHEAEQDPPEVRVFETGKRPAKAGAPLYASM